MRREDRVHDGGRGKAAQKKKPCSQREQGWIYFAVNKKRRPFPLPWKRLHNYEVPKCRSAEVPKCRSAEVPKCRSAVIIPRLAPEGKSFSHGIFLAPYSLTGTPPTEMPPVTPSEVFHYNAPGDICKGIAANGF
jgi:hypothetical protein